MVEINRSLEHYNMYVRYGSRKKSHKDIDFLNSEDSTEMMNAADIILMLSGKKLGSVLDSLFPEKNQSDSTFLEWLEPDVSMSYMSPIKFAGILENVSKTIAREMEENTPKTDIATLKNNKLMSDFVKDINTLTKQIKIRTKVATPNA